MDALARLRREPPVRTAEPDPVPSSVSLPGQASPWRVSGVDRWSPRGVATSVFLVALLAFGLSPNITNYDSYLSFPTAVSVVHSGDLDLDELQTPAVRAHYGLVERDGSSFDFYPWVVSLLFVPAVVVLDLAGAVGLGGGAEALVEDDAMGVPHLVVSSAVTALAAALVAAVAARRSRLGQGRANVVALIVGLGFAFGTAAWSTASRALWQHGPSMALVAGALLVVVTIDQRSADRGLVILLGVLAGAAFAVRPTNVVVVVALGAWCLWRGRREAARFVAGGLLVGVPWLLVNRISYGQWIAPNHSGGRTALHADYLEALAANLVSPARGLLVWAPVVLLAVAGLVVAWRRQQADSVTVLSAGIAIGYLLLVSAGSEAWWAGHSIGPRFLTDPLPALAVLAVPAVDALVDPSRRRRAWAVWAAAAVLVWSVAINGGAAVMRETNCWNGRPVDVNEDPSRVWSIDPPQPLAGYVVLFEGRPLDAVRGTC